MVKEQIFSSIQSILKEKYSIDDSSVITLEEPKDPTHGDLTTNVAMRISKIVKKPPKQIADEIISSILYDKKYIEKIEPAGAGFINFTFTPFYYQEGLKEIINKGENFGKADWGKKIKFQVEYVSANPTGPMNVVNARAAAVGSTLVNLLNFVGYDAKSEFYINDAGAQIKKLGKSVIARMKELQGENVQFPEDGYAGEYIKDIAKKLLDENRFNLANLDEKMEKEITEYVVDSIIAQQKKDLEDFRVIFDEWVKESSIRETGMIEQILEYYESNGYTVRQSWEEWLEKRKEYGLTELTDKNKGKEYGLTELTDKSKGKEISDSQVPISNEKKFAILLKFPTPESQTENRQSDEWVLVKSNGEPTYLLPDIAYHIDKWERGFSRVIDIWGPDHQGHIPPMKAGLKLLGYPDDFLEVLIVQQVNLIKDGKVLDMSKRKGQFISMRELIDEVGTDPARFFFLLRKVNAHLDFDIDLAKKQTDENPVYYVQYAHARICSILRFAEESPIISPFIKRGLREILNNVNLSLLTQKEEIDLIKVLLKFPDVVSFSAKNYEPHRIAVYLQDTAGVFHHFYTKHRVVTDDIELTKARLILVESARVVFRNALKLIGVSAPEKM